MLELLHRINTIHLCQNIRTDDDEDYDNDDDGDNNYANGYDNDYKYADRMYNGECLNFYAE